MLTPPRVVCVHLVVEGNRESFVLSTRYRQTPPNPPLSLSHTVSLSEQGPSHVNFGHPL